jgi:hypothetical protein
MFHFPFFASFGIIIDHQQKGNQPGYRQVAELGISKNESSRARVNSPFLLLTKKTAL